MPRETHTPDLSALPEPIVESRADTRDSMPGYVSDHARSRGL
jgi:hypothetical protein